MASKVTVGRVVHYMGSDGEHLPALVTKVWNDDLVNLKIALNGNEPDWIHRTSVVLNESKSPGTWHWPEAPSGAATGEEEVDMTNGTNGAKVDDATTGGGGTTEVLGTVCLTAEQVAGVKEKLTQAAGALKKVQTMTANGRVTLSGTAADVSQVQAMLAAVVELQSAAVVQLGVK